jgi:hypothetical protein
MMTKCIRIIFLLALTGCIGSSKFQKTEDEKWKPRYQVLAGINKGGVIENTDFSETPDVAVDAFSGATKMGGNIGAHVQLPLRKSAFETGIDYMYNGQTFTYNDPERGFIGKREIGTSQVLIPLTYNFGLFRKTYYSSLVYIKLGYVAEFNFINVRNSGQLPDYNLKHYSGGFTAGISSTPVALNNGASLGLYFDVYRGSKTFNDFYNSKLYEMPGTSFFKFGLIYQFK